MTQTRKKLVGVAGFRSAPRFIRAWKTTPHAQPGIWICAPRISSHSLPHRLSASIVIFRTTTSVRLCLPTCKCMRLFIGDEDDPAKGFNIHALSGKLACKNLLYKLKINWEWPPSYVKFRENELCITYYLVEKTSNCVFIGPFCLV